MEVLKAAGMVFGALSVTVIVGIFILYLLVLRPQDKKRKDDQFKNIQDS